MLFVFGKEVSEAFESNLIVPADVSNHTYVRTA